MRSLALIAALAVTGCGPTEVLVGDAPGLARVVAGMPGVAADFTADSIPIGDAITNPIGRPAAVAALPDGSFYFADLNARRIGHVTAAGVLSWPVGAGLCRPFAFDPDPTKICFATPTGLAIDSSGALLIADKTGAYVYRYDPVAARVSIVVGTGQTGVAPDGTPASGAAITTPSDLAVGSDGSVYVVETDSHRVIRVSPDGKVFAFAGTGVFGDSGDGGPARQAELALPQGIALMGDTLYIADTENSRIRRVIHDTILGYAGVGAAGFSGDGHAVSLALFDHPTRLAAGTALLFVADEGNRRVRLIRVGPDSITTFAGTGATALSADLQEAGRTDFTLPAGMALAGRAVFLTDADQHVVRRVVR